MMLVSVCSLWGEDDDFAGRAGQPLGSLLEAWEITADRLGARGVCSRRPSPMAGMAKC